MNIDKGATSSTSLTNTKGNLSRSWNGFSNVRSSFEFSDYHPAMKQDGDREREIKTEKREIKDLFITPENSYQLQRTNPKVMAYPRKSDHKVVRTPRHFPGVKHVVLDNETDKKEASNETKQLETEELNANLTLEDMEKVLGRRKERSPCREGNKSTAKNQSEGKLPRIKINEVSESPSEGQLVSLGSPRTGSHHFNYVCMMTELNEVCQMKNNNVVRRGEKEANLLKLKTIQETRRRSAFAPRRSDGDRIRREHATRCRGSVADLDTQAFPRRYFVKLDPVRASAVSVNLSAWNDSSQRCRVLSENLRKLDEQGIAPAEKERKKLVRQWIRETKRVGGIHTDQQHPSTELESNVNTTMTSQ